MRECQRDARGITFRRSKLRQLRYSPPYYDASRSPLSRWPPEVPIPL